MGFDTKPNFSSNKFEQCSNDIMNLSGCTQIYGTFDIESGATINICDNAGDGKVLTSNASGTATWQTGGGVTGRANSIAYFDNAGDISGSTIIIDNSSKYICLSGTSGSLSNWTIKGRDGIAGGYSYWAGSDVIIKGGGDYDGGECGNHIGDVCLIGGDDSRCEGDNSGHVYLVPGCGPYSDIVIGSNNYDNGGSGDPARIVSKTCDGWSDFELYVTSSKFVKIGGFQNTGWLCLGDCNGDTIKFSDNTAQSSIFGGTGCGLIGEGRGSDILISAGNPIVTNDDGGNLILEGATPNGSGSYGKIQLCNLPAKSAETNIVYIDSEGSLSSGATSGGGGSVGWSGDTTNAVGTYADASGICAEPNLTFDGTSLEVKGATHCTKILDEQLVFSRNSANYIHAGTAGGTISIISNGLATSSANALVDISTIDVSLRYGNAAAPATKLQTTNTGVCVTGVLDVSTCVTSSIISGTTCLESSFIYSTGMVCAAGNLCAVGCVTSPIIQLTTGAANGCVLVSNAGGCGIWTTPSSGGGIDWTGTTANGIGTYVSSTCICSEPNLTFDGTTLIAPTISGSTLVKTACVCSTGTMSTCGAIAVYDTTIDRRLTLNGAGNDDSNGSIYYYDETNTCFGDVRLGHNSANNGIYINPSNNRVGFWDDAPSYTLDVCGTVRGTTYVISPILCATSCINSGGNLFFDCGATRYIGIDAMATSTVASNALVIQAQQRTSNGTYDCGGTLHLRGGCDVAGIDGCGGNVYICGGCGSGDNGGDIYLCGGTSGEATGIIYSYNIHCTITCGRSPVFCASTAFRTTGTGYRYCGGTGCGTAVDWVATSDCRIKKCIEPITSALSKVDALCGVCYDLCEDGTKDMGLIAQEVICIEPRLVAHGDVPEEYEKYGINDELLSLKYDKFAGLFVEAIKELKVQNECLQNQINELNNKK